MTTVAVVGTGSIGSHLIERLRNEKIEICFVRCSDRHGTQHSFHKQLREKSPDAVFLAIPTKDRGEAARDYILTCVERGVPIITCEKGALARHADVLRPYMHLIGYSATVGGGTQILGYLQGRRLHTGPVEIEAVINGTINFLFYEMGQGRSLHEAYTEALRLGYAEPGATDPLSLINGELKDVLLKTCVLLNVCVNVGSVITPEFIPFRPLGEEDLRRYASKRGEYRFVVSFSNTANPTDEYYGSTFSINNHGPWNVRGEFKKITPSQAWLPGGVGNAICITEGELGKGGIFVLSGPGAGLEPTTSAMLADFERLCK